MIITFLYEDDFKQTGRQGMPIVLCYNGRDHISPSCIMSPAEYNQWKLEILVKLSRAAREVIGDIDSQYFTRSCCTSFNSN